MKKIFFLLPAILATNMILFSQDSDMKPGQLTNFMSFSLTGTGTWTIPSNVTKIAVEAWGGGGGGSQYCGGGGGGIANVFNGAGGGGGKVIIWYM